MARFDDYDDVDGSVFDDEDEDTLKDKYLTFHVGGEEYGIEIRHVTEIVGRQSITSVPDMPNFIKGVINLRGRVIPVMDVRLRFDLDGREYDDRTCVVIVDLRGTPVGLVVDTVRDVILIHEDAVSPPPKIQKGKGGRFIQGIGRVGDEVKILLDVNKLLHDEEIERIEATGEFQPV